MIAQTLEVLADSGYVPGATGYRTFTVNIGYSEGNSAAVQAGPPPVPAILPTTLLNPSGSGYTTQLPGQYLVAASGGTLSGTWQFILDGRWLHAFNGSGMTANAVEANFRYNGINLNPALGSTPAMDEDYDAVDLENWFLAMQSADGSVIIPSFHRPAVVRYDLANTTNDWSRSPGWTFDMSASSGQLPLTATTRRRSPTLSLAPTAGSPTTWTTTATARPTRSGSTWAIRPGATPKASSTSRSSRSWSSASTAGSR